MGFHTGETRQNKPQAVGLPMRTGSVFGHSYPIQQLQELNQYLLKVYEEDHLMETFFSSSIVPAPVFM